MTEDEATGAAAEARPLVRVDHPAPGADGPIEHVALVTLDRPEALNALSFRLVEELVSALEALDADPDVRAIVLTGARGRAFAAGADIAEMVHGTPASMARDGSFDRWDEVGRLGTPLIAAVRGFALGGGCELAMACDMIVAGDDAKFGQPEIRLGVIPGAGGTQRLPRAIGKAKATELILTGRSIDAVEAERLGLVTQVVPATETVPAALALAQRIAEMAPLAVRAAKDAIARAYEMPLEAGLRHERQAFLDLFGTDDQKEGMAAFLEKRKPRWQGR